VLAGDQQPVEAPPGGGTQRIFECPTCQVAVNTQYGPAELRLFCGGTLDQPLDTGQASSVRQQMAVCATLSTLLQVLCRGQCYVPELCVGVGTV
jgi:hypothetical protein